MDHAEMRPEHSVYERLRKNKVRHIQTCLGGEDVHTSGGLQQKTRIKPVAMETGERDSGESFPYETLPSCARIHYRIFMDKILRPLTDFYDFSYLSLMLRDALVGECYPISQMGRADYDSSSL